tara:strand:- start:471 stop:1058 length:588 start_codon:yes stop_codon:yes gene_type:complete
MSSAQLAKEKGSFPLYDQKSYCEGAFVHTLSPDVQKAIKANGIRNSHLLSIAPTGTISLTADNVSSGIEPPFALHYDRTIQQFNGHQIERVEDYAYRQGVKGRTANEISGKEHVEVLGLVSKYMDSAVSKTCNVGDDVTYEEFKDLYLTAWKLGAKGITTFRAAGKRYGVLNEVSEEPEAQACFIDPDTGLRECE